MSFLAIKCIRISELQIVEILSVDPNHINYRFVFKYGPCNSQIGSGLSGSVNLIRLTQVSVWQELN